jgi:hypothetical protein
VSGCEYAFAVGSFGDTIWIADSGASTHMGNVDDGLCEVTEINEPIKVGNGNKARAVKKGSLPLMLLQKNGETIDILLEDYKYSPDLGVCLFSLMKAIQNGWSISNRDLIITLKKGSIEIQFDQIMKTKDGILCGVELLPRLGETANVGEDGATDKPSGYMDINRFHRTYGHASEQAMRRTAKFYNWKLTGTLEACEDCQMSNAQQKGVHKTTANKAKNPGERIFIDCSSVVDHSSLGGATRWLGVTDDATGFLWSKLLESESDAPKAVMTFIKKLADRKTPVKNIRCDDASVWHKLRRLSEESDHQVIRVIKYEFTARDTPQLNGKQERAFAVTTRRIRATLNAAKLPEDLRKVLWGEAVMYCTDVHNILQSRMYEKPAYNAFYKEDFPSFKNMRQFGEIGYVKWGPKIKAKLVDRGIPMMYLGRARNHSADTYRMMNLATQKIINTRDATWMNKVYGEWKRMSLPTTPDVIAMLPTILNVETGEQVDTTTGTNQQKLLIVSDAETSTTTEVPTDTSTTEDSHPRPHPTGPTKAVTVPKIVGPEYVTKRSTRANPVKDSVGDVSQKALRELSKLHGSFNPDALSLADKIREASSVPTTSQEGTPEHNSTQVEAPMAAANIAVTPFTLIDRFGGDIGTFFEFANEIGLSAVDMDPSQYKDKFDKPGSFEEAWDHEDPFQRERWREAINKEFKKMEERQVWKKIKRTDMEEGRRCVKHKWVFDIKRSGIFRARLVACGYSQVPMIDYSLVFAAVANDVSFRLLIIAMIVYNYKALIFDVETAFLMGDLEERIYMDCPKGMSHEPDECLLLIKTIYGLVQSARQYATKFTNFMKSIGFLQCGCDPCLMMRRGEAGTCYVLTYVDDNLVVGDDKAIKQLLSDVERSEFNITVEHELKDYLSCEIVTDKEKKKAWIGQPHMVKKIIKTFEDEFKGMQVYQTPGTPGSQIVSPKEGDPILEDNLQKKYRTGVGMLMYCIKHSRPDIANAVRELTKVLGKATPAAYKEMLRVAKFISDTRNMGLKVDPVVPEDGKWKLEVYSDSDWAGSKDDRRSVGSFYIFLNNVLIEWRSKSQKVVSLSSSEAEFYACAEAVKEVPFIAQILLFMGIPVDLPVKVKVDNVGAIFMAENKTSSSRTRHMDTRWWYVNQLQEEDKLIKVEFVRTKDNASDVGTKNVTVDIYKTHTERMIKEKPS